MKMHLSVLALRSHFRWAALALVVTTGLVLAAGPPIIEKPLPPLSEVQEVVFLGETRPVLIRLHVKVDDKPLPAAWDDFMKYLFAYADVNGDGVLSREEAARAPTVSMVRNGPFGVNPGARRGKGKLSAGPEFAVNKDGNVTLAAFSAYYRRNGFVPFQVRVVQPQANQLDRLAFLRGGRVDPSPDKVSEAIFALLDTDHDGKLTRKELLAAESVLLRMDEDEDEIVTAAELVPNAKPKGGGMFAGMMGRARGKGSTGKILIPIETPGEVPADLVRSLQERYGPKSKKPADKKLSRKDLGLDELTFARLDVNKDGVLDSKELAGFVNLPPDLDLVVRMGSTKKARVKPMPIRVPGPLASKVRMTEEVALLDPGLERVEVRTSEEMASFDTIAGIAKQQFLAQFKSADTDNNGYLDEKEAKASDLYRDLFKMMDRDGDGKVTEKEALAWIDQYFLLMNKATECCAALHLANNSRGLFDLLDTNRDGRLSVREMRGAAGLLGQIDRTGKGYLTRADIPRTWTMTVKRGSPDSEEARGAAAFAKFYGGGYEAEKQTPMRGPRWFQKMDRNRDGDVSRKEFLFSDELFRKIDKDGDGLISVEEAEAYDKELRKQD